MRDVIREAARRRSEELGDTRPKRNIACLETPDGTHVICPVAGVTLEETEVGIRASISGSTWIESDLIVDVQEVR